MTNSIDKIEKNARAIKTIISLLVVIAGMIYGFCVFVYQNQTHTKEINDLKIRLATLETVANEKYQEMNRKISLNEKEFQMTSTKLEVSLVKISADLQFIKEQLMKKGMDNDSMRKSY